MHGKARTIRQAKARRVGWEVHMDDDLEAVAVKLAATKEREYTHGWRAYVNGAKRPTTHWAAVGWDEAQYADQACWRPILWSRNREE
ncbi:MAG: hypothetical protein EBR82_66855 [Caulobacteraceae bacterium]|nr:hypothetical protein [Caulobacteraceae bacterium]